MHQKCASLLGQGCRGRGRGGARNSPPQPWVCCRKISIVSSLECRAQRQTELEDTSWKWAWMRFVLSWPHAGEIKWSKWERKRKSESGGDRDRLGEVQREREWKSPPIGIRPYEAIHPCVLFPNPLSSNQLIFILKPVWVGCCYLQTKV